MTEQHNRRNGQPVDYAANLKDIEVDIQALFNLIKFHYKFVLIVTAICFALGIFYALRLPEEYRSTALVQVDNNNADVSGLCNGGNGANSLSTMPSLQGGSTATVETALIKSPYVLGTVAKQLGSPISASAKTFPIIGHLVNKLYFGKEVAAPFMGLSSYSWGGQKIKVSVLEVPNELLGRTLTVVQEKGGKYRLLAPGGQLILKGKIGQLVSANYQGVPVSLQVDELIANPGAQFTVQQEPLNTAAGALLGGLSISEEAGTGILELKYTSTNPDYAQKVLNAILAVAIMKNVEDKSKQAGQVLQFLDKQLPGVQNNLAQAEGQFNEYRAQSGTVDVTAEGQILLQMVAGLQQTLEQLKMQKLELLQKFTPQHPFVVALNQKELEIEKQLKLIENKVSRLPLAGQEEQNLERDITVRNGLYLAMLQNLQQMQLVKAGLVSDVQVLSTASYPVTPIPSKARYIIPASLVFGFILSILILSVRKMLSPTVEDPDIVEQALGVPVNSILPYSNTQRQFAKLMKQNRTSGIKRDFLLAKQKPKDLTIEGLRSLRTALQMSLLEAKTKVMAVTSCSPNAGKSFISTNLCYLFSELSNKKIIIIDADIRRGHINRYFGLQREPGLASYLMGQASIPQIIQSMVPGKLDFIATGHYPDKPAELLERTALKELIDSLSQQYDMVMIDTPPVLAVTDAALILKHSVTNLLVIGVGKDQLKEIEHAKRILEKSGVHLSGLVFNNIFPRSHVYGYGYGYGKYGYYYAYDKDK